MALFDESPEKPKRAYEIGQDLSMLSLGELEEGIFQLHAEITRLKDEIKAKDFSKTVAEALFRRE